MNDQNETAQLRYLEETAIRLRQNGFMVEPIEDHHLPVCWEKGRLCRITGKGSVLYRQENVDSTKFRSTHVSFWLKLKGLYEVFSFEK